MPSRHPHRAVPALFATALVLAACTSGDPEVTPTATSAPSPSIDQPETTTPTEDSSPIATADATESDTLVLAGQFTAFVGADGSGPACDAFWWADALGGQPYVGLSDARDVTAAGRVEPLCLLGFDGVVELTVTTPDGAVETLDLDATEPDGGVGLLEVSLAREPATGVVLAAWQDTPSPAPDPSETVVVAQDATPGPSASPSEVSEVPTVEATEFSESENELDAGGVRVDWAVPVDARGQYTLVARQGELVADSAVTVVAPTRLEVGPESEGTRTVTLHHGPGEPVPVGVYRVEDEFGAFVVADGFRGRQFVLVEDLGLLADGASVVVATSDLEPGRYCVTSPAVEFVDCRPDEGSDVVPGSGWFQ